MLRSSGQPISRTNLLLTTQRNTEDKKHNLKATTISAELTIRGNVHSTGPLTIDGAVKGDVQCTALFIKEGAQISGNVSAERVVVSGKVVGSIEAQKLCLTPTSRVEGEVLHGHLEIMQGTDVSAQFQRMGET